MNAVETISFCFAMGSVVVVCLAMMVLCFKMLWKLTK